MSVRLATVTNSKRQWCYRLRLMSSGSPYSNRYEDESKYFGHWPKQIPRLLGWQINQNTRFCLVVASNIRPHLQLLFVEKREDEKELIRQYIEPKCLKVLFKYYEDPEPTKDVKTESILSRPHMLHPDRLVFYENFGFEKELWSLSSIHIRQKLLRRKSAILFEIAFYAALTKAVAMKYIIDHMHHHQSEPKRFEDEEAKARWIWWSELEGPHNEAHSLADMNEIPREDVYRSLDLIDCNYGEVLPKYDVKRLLKIYAKRKEERPELKR